jgi:hypothetical protein
LFEGRVAFIAIAYTRTNLYEFVRAKSAVHLATHRLGIAVFADLHQRVTTMRETA